MTVSTNPYGLVRARIHDNYKFDCNAMCYTTSCYIAPRGITLCLSISNLDAGSKHPLSSPTAFQSGSQSFRSYSFFLATVPYVPYHAVPGTPYRTVPYGTWYTMPGTPYRTIPYHTVPYIHAVIHTYTHSHTFTCIHTYVRTYVQTQIDTDRHR